MDDPPRHKHCKHCGFSFEPAQAWLEYCSPKCIEDWQKLHPPIIQNPPTFSIPYPNWSFPSTGTAQINYWYCGICGKNIPNNESHVHSFTFTSGT